MAKRNLYLSNISVEEALSKYFSALEGLHILKTEEIPAEDGLDRVTSEAVFARLSSPLFNAAAMDGIAVKAADTIGARETSPITLLEGKDFINVDTGDPVHYPYDAVIMAEDVIINDDTKNIFSDCQGRRAQIMESASVWQHIRPVGEDIVAGEMIIASRHKIRPIDIGVLFSAGITRIKVYSKPKIAVIPTGDEIIDAPRLSAKDSTKEGAIIESNSRMFEALVSNAGGKAVRFAPAADDFEKLKEIILKAVNDFDMVLINAGSSAGREDYTVQVLREIGEVIVHGVAMKPGKPVILAKVKGKPVIGTPGYPVSAYLSYEIFASPVISALSGNILNEQRIINNEKRIEAIITRRIVSSLKHREYVRVKVGRVNGSLVASPLARGAGAAMSLVRADGFCVIDQQSEGVEAGEKIQIELFRSIEEIDRTLVSIGSHDLILDVIADMMSFNGDASLSSAHLGSLAGLTALYRGECHIAPIHLLDEETGFYNTGWLKKTMNSNIMLGEQFTPNKKSLSDVCLIKGVGRVQGLIVQKGNPLKINSLSDICRCRFINRQRGAGTRILLDYLLKKEGIDTAGIDGYTRESATHMAVAAAVQSGSADAGMGIASAAKALDLDFIPMGEEEYDFAIFSETLKMKEMKIFIDILKSKEFHRKLAELGSPLKAYTWENTGEIIKI